MRLKLGAVLALAGSLALADEGTEMGRRVQDLLHAHQAEVFACVQAAKQEAEGELLLRVFVGEDGKAARVDVLKDRSSLGGCVADKLRGWDLSSLKASPGDQLVFPLAFHAENPYLAHVELPKSDAKIVPAVVWPGGKASLTLIRLAPSVRLGAHTHPSAEAVYVLKGMLRVRQAGRPQESLKAGDAAFFAAGEPHSLEAAPLAPTELLQIFSPAGPEAAYADHAAGGTTPSKQAPARPAWLATAVKSWPILGGKGAVKLLLDGSGAPVALDELSAEAGAVVPLHKHESSDELLYILDGKGTTTISGKSFAVSAGDGVRIPTGLEHSLTVDEKMTAVQVYAPAGPEQRFKK